MAQQKTKSRTPEKILTPVNIIWENILFISVFGTIDSIRVQEIMSTMLSKVVETGSKIII